MTLLVALIVIICISAGIGLYVYLLTSSKTKYRTAIFRERQEKDVVFRNSPESPFADSREKFTTLRYFEPDLKFKLRARLIVVPNPKPVLLSTSTGEDAQFYEYAFTEFTLNGTQNRLLMFKAEGQQTLFLSFKDLTNGKETYGAGRYLDIEEPTQETFVLLDFNKANNPYCAYNDNYSCPFPPKENYLKVAIEAGEKSYH